MKKFLLVVLSAFFIFSCGSETNTSTQTSNENQATQEATATEKEPSGLGDGTYMVGEDIQAGMYKVILSENAMGMGYVERAKSVAMGIEDIIANEALQGNGYVKIEKGDFAVKLQGVKITKK